MSKPSESVLGLFVCAAGGAEKIRDRLVEPAQRQGWRVAVTATPAAYEWLAGLGEVDALEAVTGLPVRHRPRLLGEVSPHPVIDCYAVVPATANTIAKLALGLADNQALTHLSEAVGAPDTPVVVFPRVNAWHVRHPAWDSHLASLRAAGVHLIYGDDVWELLPPDTMPNRELPWSTILDAINSAAD